MSSTYTALLGILSQITESSFRTPLDLVGLVALADLQTVARRTALTGTSALADALLLCPGLHRQQDAPSLNGGDYPICAAMTTDYVFRIENEATVFYMQKVGRAGHLTTLKVSHNRSVQSSWGNQLFQSDSASIITVTAYLVAMMLSVLVLGLIVLLEDVYGLVFVGLLIFVRIINVVVIRRRAVKGWKGQQEPGVQSDLIVLLSQDRWIRLQGAVDDVKAVTSGQWLREQTVVESACVAFATLVAYLNVGMATSASHNGKILILILLFSTTGLLGAANEYTRSSCMYGRTITPRGSPQPYSRRLVLTEQLVEETGRSDWALKLGMAQREDITRWKMEDGPKTASKTGRNKGFEKIASSTNVFDDQVTL